MKRDNTTECTCDKCGAVAHAVAGKPHRRCGGGEGAPLRHKHEPRPAKTPRGTWN